MALIRSARPDDQAALEAIVREAYEPYIARNGLTPGPMKDDYRDLIDRGLVHVLEDDKGLGGLVVVITVRERALLDNVAVSARLRGKGLGRQLIAFAEELARVSGHQEIDLYTQEIMTENIKLYGLLGYRETHRAIEKGLKRVYMRKVL